jgi:hypothetical protein
MSRNLRASSHMLTKLDSKAHEVKIKHWRLSLPDSNEDIATKGSRTVRFYIFILILIKSLKLNF